MARVIRDPHVTFWHKLTKGRKGPGKVFTFYCILLSIARCIYLGKIGFCFWSGNHFLGIIMTALHFLHWYFAECIYSKSKKYQIVATERERDRASTSVDASNTQHTGDDHDLNEDFSCCCLDVLCGDNLNDASSIHTISRVLGRLVNNIVFRFCIGPEFAWICENYKKFEFHHEKVRDARIYDSGQITEQEVNAFLFTKEMQCTKSVFCISGTFMKTIPLTLIYLFERKDAQFPDFYCCWEIRSLEPLKLIVLLGCIFLAAHDSNNYALENWDYCKTLEFKHIGWQRNYMQLKVPSRALRFYSWVNNGLQISIRLYVYGYLFQKNAALVLFPYVVAVYIIWIGAWLHLCPEDCRASYENPPRGVSPPFFSLKNLFHGYVKFFCFHATPHTILNVIYYDGGFILLFVSSMVFDEFKTRNASGSKSFNETDLYTFQGNFSTMFFTAAYELCASKFNTYLPKYYNSSVDVEEILNNKTYCTLQENQRKGEFYSDSTKIFDISSWIVFLLTVLSLCLNLFHVCLLNWQQVNIRDIPVLLENSVKHWKDIINNHWKSKINACSKCHLWFLGLATTTEKEENLDLEQSSCAKIISILRGRPSAGQRQGQGTRNNKTDVEMTEILETTTETDENETVQLVEIPVDHALKEELLEMRNTLLEHPNAKVYKLFNVFVNDFQNLMLTMSSYKLRCILDLLENYVCRCATLQQEVPVQVQVVVHNGNGTIHATHNETDHLHTD